MDKGKGREDPVEEMKEEKLENPERQPQEGGSVPQTPTTPIFNLDFSHSSIPRRPSGTARGRDNREAKRREEERKKKKRAGEAKSVLQHVLVPHASQKKPLDDREPTFAEMPSEVAENAAAAVEAARAGKASSLPMLKEEQMKKLEAQLEKEKLATKECQQKRAELNDTLEKEHEKIAERDELIKTYKETISKFIKDLAESRAANNQRGQQLEYGDKRLSDLEKEIVDLEAKVAQSNKERDTAGGDLKACDNNVRVLKKKLEDTSKERDNAKADLEGVIAEASQLEDDYQTNQTEYDDLVEEHAQLQAAQEETAIEANKHQDQLRQEVAASLQALAEREQDNEDLRQTVAHRDEEIANLKRQVEGHEAAAEQRRRNRNSAVLPENTQSLSDELSGAFDDDGDFKSPPPYTEPPQSARRPSDVAETPRWSIFLPQDIVHSTISISPRAPQPAQSPLLDFYLPSDHPEHSISISPVAPSTPPLPAQSTLNTPVDHPGIDVPLPASPSYTSTGMQTDKTDAPVAPSRPALDHPENDLPLPASPSYTSTGMQTNESDALATPVQPSQSEPTPKPAMINEGTQTATARAPYLKSQGTQTASPNRGLRTATTRAPRTKDQGTQTTSVDMNMMEVTAPAISFTLPRFASVRFWLLALVIGILTTYIVDYASLTSWRAIWRASNELFPQLVSEARQYPIGTLPNLGAGNGGPSLGGPMQLVQMLLLRLLGAMWDLFFFGRSSRWTHLDVQGPRGVVGLSYSLEKALGVGYGRLG